MCLCLSLSLFLYLFLAIPWASLLSVVVAVHDYILLFLSFWNRTNGTVLASCFILKAALETIKIDTENETILDIISANVQYKHMLSPV